MRSLCITRMCWLCKWNQEKSICRERDTSEKSTSFKRLLILMNCIWFLESKKHSELDSYFWYTSWLIPLWNLLLQNRAKVRFLVSTCYFCSSVFRLLRGIWNWNSLPHQLSHTQACSAGVKYLSHKENTIGLILPLHATTFLSLPCHLPLLLPHAFPQTGGVLGGNCKDRKIF